MAPLHRAPSIGPKTFHHFTHPKHPLQLIHTPDEYTCNGCNTLGYGSRYHCQICNFNLHEICSTCPTKFTSPLHPHHRLLLVNHPANDRFCDLCGDLVHGLFYQCRVCELDIHPLCTQFPARVQHARHPQHCLTLQPAGPSPCACCGRVCTSWRYRCVECRIDVHLECVLAPPPPPQRGDCAVGIPVGSGVVSKPIQQGQPGGSNNNGKGKKIYNIVGRMAARAVVTSIIGVPLGF